MRICTGIDSHAITDPFEEARAIELDARTRAEARHAAVDAPGLVAAMTTFGYAAIAQPSDGDCVILDANDAALADADQLLIPSRVESIPLVFSDAVRAGCAVVAMPVGDLPGLVGEEPPCGVVAEAATAGAFARALATALRVPSDRFAAGISQRAAEFSLTRVARQLLPAQDGH